MRTKQIFTTALGKNFDWKNEAYEREHMELHDVALVIQKLCKGECEHCMFDNGGACIFPKCPENWQLTTDNFYDDEFKKNFELFEEFAGRG